MFTLEIKSFQGYMPLVNPDRPYFECPHPYIEWTWLAFSLVMANKVVGILDEPTFRIYDTPGSASKSEEYLLAHIELLHRMMKYRPRQDIQDILRQKLAESWHTISDNYRQQHKLIKAWHAHLKSISGIKGWKYISYTRKLLLDLLFRRY